MADNTVSVDVELAIKKATADLEKLTGRFDTFADKAEKGIGGVDKKLGTMRLSLAYLAGEMAGKAINAVTSFAGAMVRDGIKAAQGYEDALTELNTALQLSGNYSVKASQDFEEFASAIQQTTKYSDDAVLSAGALIANISGLSGGALQKATQQAIDLSAALGKDLGTTAQLVGKVMVGETGTLSKYGIVIGEAGTKAEKTAAAIAALAKFSGAAEKQAQTYSGAVAMLANNYGDFQKQVGFLLIKNPVVIAAIAEVSKRFAELATWVQKNEDQAKGFVSDGLIAIVNGAGGVALALDVLVKGLQLVWANAGVVINSLQTLNNFKNLDFSGAKKNAEETAASFEQLAGIIKGTADESYLSKVAQSLADLSVKLEGVKDKGGAGNASAEESNTQKTVSLEQEKQQSFMETLLWKTAAVDQMTDLEAQYNADMLAYKNALADGDIEAANRANTAKAKSEKAFRNAQVQGTMTALGTIATLQNSTSKELFFVGKAAAMAQATISAYQGAASALASVPYPYNFVAAALVGAAGLANVANIASQQPGFETGGVVGGNSLTGDNVPIRVNSREAVMTLDQQQRLFDIANGSAAAGGNGITVIVEGNVIADSPSRIDELAEAISNRVRFNNTPLYASRMV